MVLVCRGLFSNLCTLRGQFGRTQTGFKFSTDGFHGHSLIFKRQQAFGCRDVTGVPAQRWSVRMSHSWAGAACPGLRAVCTHELPAGAAALPVGSTATAFSYVMGSSMYCVGCETSKKGWHVCGHKALCPLCRGSFLIDKSPLLQTPETTANET